MYKRQTKDIGDTNYDEVVSMMVGRSVTNLYPERDYRQDETVLELKDICGKGVHNVNIRLHKGEILGVAGLLGSGTIELSKIVYGALPMDSGEIYINGEKKDCSSPKKALKAGIGFVSDDRDESILLNEASAIFPQTILAKENMCIDVDGGTVYEK